MPATITFHGAAREVTGSCHLLKFDGLSILLDCGMHQGGREADRENARPFPFDPAELHAVILSHAHLDHSGLLPRLVRDGYRGPIHCTRQTRDLLYIMLKDAAHLQERDVEWENKRRQRAGREPLEPLYRMEDVDRTLSQCRPLEVAGTTEIAAGVHLNFLDAGHILGSAVVQLSWQDDGRERRLVFSGDLGNPGTLLMRDPQIPERADWVLMEGTYGNREHKIIDNTHEELAEILAKAHEAGGNVLIPAFAVGRTQEVIYHLARLNKEGRLPQRRVYLDSPMAIEVSALYLRNLAELEQQDLLDLTEHGRLPLESVLDFVHPTRSTEESMAINRISSGAIIIAGSGMCEGGRIRHHLKYNLWKREAQLVIVGFQARGTLGRRLVDGAESVRMLGSVIAVRAGIHTLGGFSAHAGRNELLDWSGRIEGEPHFFLVHGEEEALESLAGTMRERGKLVDIPDQGQTLTLA